MKPEGEREAQIRAFLIKKGWIDPVNRVEFLAAGEYNENYRVSSGNERFVFRINRGSQLGIKNQIEYEYGVLRCLEHSGVTPKPFFCDPEPSHFGGGVLLMEYIQGVPLDYERDLETAARIFAAIHSQPIHDNLIIQKHPVLDIARESLGLITRYHDHPLEGVKHTLLRYHEKIIELAGETEELFSEEPMCVVNTEVNSGNFIIGEQSGYLVDWEKAVVSFRYQDLGHFLVPTTTLWKTDYVFSIEKKEDFLRVYASHLEKLVPFDALFERTSILERTILLRAMSWCFMAYYEYTRSERALKDSFTFSRIQKYLREIKCFLK